MSDVAIGLSLFAFLMLSYWLVRALGGDAARRPAQAARDTTTVAPVVQAPIVPPVIQASVAAPAAHTTQVVRDGAPIPAPQNVPAKADAPVAAAHSQHPDDKPAAKAAWQEPVKPTVQSTLVQVERPHQTPLVTSTSSPPTVTVSVTRDSDRTPASSLARGSGQADTLARAAVAAAKIATPQAAQATAPPSSPLPAAQTAKPSIAATLPSNYVPPSAPAAPARFSDAPVSLPEAFQRASTAATLAPSPAAAPPQPAPVVAYDPLPPLPAPTPRPTFERAPPLVERPSIAGTRAPGSLTTTPATAVDALPASDFKPDPATAHPSITATLPPDYRPAAPPPAPKTYVVGPIELPEAFIRADSRATVAPPSPAAPLKPVVAPVVAYEPLPPLPAPRAIVERDAPVIVAPSVQGTLGGAPASDAAAAGAAGLAAAVAAVAAPAIAAQARSDESPSRYAVRAQNLPRSEATPPRAAAAPEPQPSGPSAAVPDAQAVVNKPAVDPSYLRSLQRRGVRLIGPDVDPIAIDALMPFVPRPQTASIWSNTVPRRTLTDDEILASEILAASTVPAIKAERVPVRAEPLLARPEVRQTLAPQAQPSPSQPSVKAAVTENLIGPISLTPTPQMSASVGTAGGYAIAQVRVADTPAETARPKVGATLPPGALGEE